MSERPILFSGPLVRAILAGRKTETRRLVTKGTSTMVKATRDAWAGVLWEEAVRNSPVLGMRPETGLIVPNRDTMTHGIMPKIRVGDTLWVRESWRTSAAWDETKPSELPTSAPIIFMADDDECDSWEGKGRPSIFMPRWASRISLRVVDVQAERLCAITEDGAQAEGVHPIATFSRGDDLVSAVNGINEGMAGPPPQPHRDAFQGLWDKINGKREGATWSSNPWVWVLKFEVAEVRR